MRRGNSKAEPGTRGGTTWNDGVYSIDGGSGSDGPLFLSTSEELSDGSGFSTGSGVTAFPEKTWFAPVMADDTIQILGGNSTECKDGVCPVPWAVKEEPPVIKEDVVNHPSHYTDAGGIECIEAIEAQLTAEEFQGYLRACCVKYLWRYKLKGKPLQDLEKCRWYLERLMQTLED